MAETVAMPKLAKSMKRGKIVEWKVPEGEWVEEGQTILIVETEKIALECESPAAGYLHHVANLDKIYAVGETLALLAATEAELEELQVSQPTPEGAPGPGAVAGGERQPHAPAGDSRPKGRVKATPAAKNLARKHNVDMAAIAGSGPGGRIKKEDVINHMKCRPDAVEAPPPEIGRGEAADDKRVKAVIPFRGMRQSIAEHMMQSLAVSAQLSNMGEIDMTELVRLRKSFIAKEDEIGTRVSYTDLIVLLLSRAVQYVPLVNSSLVGDEIKIWEDINVGVAVAVETGPYDSGLLVPVIRNTERKSLTQISREVRDVTTRARQGKLTPDDLAHGTITLTNVGGMTSGWLIGTPIINQPQSVIVATGAILQKPVGIDGKIELRPTMTISFTYDHRILDGAPIAKFYSRIMELAQNPELLLL